MCKGTIVRLILVAIVLINLILKSCGFDLIEIEESVIYEIVEVAIEVGILAVAVWKNNSVSKKAIMADEFLKTLKNNE